MPVYEFYCPQCKSSFELLRPMSESTRQADCPSCATRSWKKMSVFSAIGRDAVGVSAAGAGGGCPCGGACSCSA